MKIFITLLPLALIANVSNYTCTKEQLDKARKEFVSYVKTAEFQEKYEYAIRKHCTKNWRDFVVYGVEK